MKKLELIKLIKEEINNVISESTPMNKIMYFGYNYPKDFIDKVWADDIGIIKHLQEKFSYLYKLYGARGVFNAFYTALDKGNQRKLEDWIEKNYED